MIAIVNRLLWILPFFCFCAGYFATRLMVNQKTVLIPALIGKTADNALMLLSEKNLNPRILGLVEDPDSEPGTILNQIPHAESKARPHQTVFLVMSARPTHTIASNWIGMAKEAIQKRCSSQAKEPLFYVLPHITPAGSCFVQYPAADAPLTETPIIYISAGIKQTYIWPSYLGAPAHAALTILKKQGIDITIIGEYATAPDTIVAQLRIIDQRPLPGSFITCDTSHKPSLHLRLGR